MTRTARAGALSHQQGVSLIGFVVFGGLVAVLFIEALRTFPLFMEYFEIQKAITRAAAEGSTPADVRRAFDKIASLSNITSVSGQDLEIERTGQGLAASVSYYGWAHLFDDVHIVIQFRASSEQTSTKAADS